MIVLSVSFFSNKEKGISQSFLFFTVLAVCFHLIYLMILDLNLEISYPYILWFPYSFLMGIGPLIFLYTQSIVLKDFRLRRKDYLLFVPLAIEVIGQLMLIRASTVQGMQVYNVPYAGVFMIVTYFLAGVSIFYYLRKSSALMSQHRSQAEQYYSSIQDKSPLTIQRLLKYYKIIWLCWLPTALLFLLFFRFQLQYLILIIPIYGLSIAITYLTYWITLENRSFVDRIVPLEKERPRNSSYDHLSQKKVEEKLAILKSLLDQENIYLEEDVSLGSLANRAKMEPNLVSFLLNAHLGVSFFEFINQARVQEFKDRLQSNQYNHLTLLAIALDCGFSSKSSFNRIFKKVTGLTPRKYMANEK